MDGDFSFEAWIYPTHQSYNTILSKGHGGTAQTLYIFGRSAGFDVNNPGKIALYLSDGTNGEWNYSNTTVPLDKWSHVAVTFDVATKKVFFFLNGLPDGQFYLTAPTAPLFKADSNPLYIGRQGFGCNCNFFNGNMDELSIWSKALTQSEIESAMTTPLLGSEADLVAYYNFNNALACVNNLSVLTLTDLSSNNLDGILTNFSLTAGCNSNWTAGSNKVQYCTGCFDFMTLTASTGILDGIYSSSYQITIKPGTQFLPGKNITLDAPIVLFEMDNTVPTTTILTIKQDGCQN